MTVSDLLAGIETRVQRQVDGLPMYPADEYDDDTYEPGSFDFTFEGWGPVYDIVVHLGEDMEYPLMEHVNA